METKENELLLNKHILIIEDPIDLGRNLNNTFEIKLKYLIDNFCGKVIF